MSPNKSSRQQIYGGPSTPRHSNGSTKMPATEFLEPGLRNVGKFPYGREIFEEAFKTILKNTPPFTPEMLQQPRQMSNPDEDVPEVSVYPLFLSCLFSPRRSLIMHLPSFRTFLVHAVAMWT